MESSVRAQRLLRDLGVERAFGRGDRYLLVGPVYELRREPEIRVRLAFERDDDDVRVGYAQSRGSGWEMVESEAYGLRSYGYYERRLKRIGNWVETPAAAGYLEL